jgi:dTDP-4-amino-4,6-dideoxygalactose transaminase
LFATNPAVTVFTEPSPDYFANHWLSAITIDPNKANGKTAEQLRLHLEQYNIESRPLWKPMHLQPVFAAFPYYGGTTAEDLFDNGLCLPSGSNLTEKDQKRITEAVHQFFH